jgi:hypothetical protein
MTKLALLTSATGGGAGIAAVRVYHSLLSVKEPDVKIDLLDIKTLGYSIPIDVSPQTNASNKIISDTHYTVEYPGFVRSSLIDQLSKYDAINLHWCSYLISCTEIKLLLDLGNKIIFTLHDFYYLLGGCHYPSACINWQDQCCTCAQIDKQRFPKYSAYDNFKLKQKIFSYPNAQLVTPSNYLTNMASSIFPNICNKPLTIRNPLDKDIYYPNKYPQAIIVNDKFKTVKIMIVADSALERRKAFPLGIAAIKEAALKLHNFNILIDLCIVGANSEYLVRELEGSSLSFNFTGRKTPAELADIYRDVHIVFSPSLEDNWPNILVESFACGAMHVVGPGHGCEEFVNLYNSGVVAESYSVQDLSESIQKICVQITSGKTKDFNVNQKSFIGDHDPLVIGRKYLNEYI